MRKSNPILVYLALAGGNAFLFGMMFVATGVYYFTTAGLNPFQLVLVGTTVETTIFLFEVPTGVVADTYSRRLSVIIGVVVCGFAFFWQGLIPTFAAILIAQVMWGIGETFKSGALAAWITDEIGEAAAGPVFLREAQIGTICGILGTIAGAVVGAAQPAHPLIVGGILMIALGVFLVFTMPEKGFKPLPREKHETPWTHMRRTFTKGARTVRGRPLLVTIILISLVFGAFSEGYDRLHEAHTIANVGFPTGLSPVGWFAVVGVGASLLGLVAAEFVRRRVNMNNQRVVATSLLLINGAISGGVIVFGLAQGFWFALSAMWVISVMRGLIYPLSRAWLNQNVESGVRATVFSMESQANALGQLAVGPVIGAIGQALGMRVALVIAGLLLTPALLLYGRVVRQGQVSAVSEPS